MKTVALKLDEFIMKSEISKYRLSKNTGINFQIIDKYCKNKVNRYDKYTLSRICEALSCDISDILELKEEA